MKTLRFIYLLLKSIIMTIIVMNIMPGIFVAVAYFRGKLVEPGDWFTPYATGFSVMVIILFIYFINEILKEDKKFDKNFNGKL